MLSSNGGISKLKRLAKTVRPEIAWDASSSCLYTAKGPIQSAYGARAHLSSWRYPIVMTSCGGRVGSSRGSFPLCSIYLV